MNILWQKAFIIKTIVARFTQQNALRLEALQQLLEVTMPQHSKETVQELVAFIPELPMDMYAKWATLFAESLFETVDSAQIADMCLNTEESNAVLSLVFVMFMESERMEKVVAQDIAALGKTIPSDSMQILHAWFKQTVPSQTH